MADIGDKGLGDIEDKGIYLGLPKYGEINIYPYLYIHWIRIYPLYPFTLPYPKFPYIIKGIPYIHYIFHIPTHPYGVIEDKGYRGYIGEIGI